MLSDPKPVVICYYFHYFPGNWVWLHFLCAVQIWGDPPPGLPTHWGIQPGRESWPCLRWAKSWALTHVFSFVNWPSIGNIYTMEDFKGKEIECQKCTYVQDGALQENTVQTNFKKPRSYYRMALIIWKANVLSSRTGPHLGWGTRLVVHALGATKHETILSFFQKATPPPHRPHPNKLAQQIHPHAVTHIHDRFPS